MLPVEAFTWEVMYRYGLSLELGDFVEVFTLWRTLIRIEQFLYMVLYEDVKIYAFLA